MLCFFQGAGRPGAGGSPRYYQAGIAGGIPTTISILALHELRR